MLLKKSHAPNTPWKAMPVKKLRELLDKLPDHLLITTNVVHNFALLTPEEEQIGYIDIAGEDVEWFDDDWRDGVEPGLAAPHPPAPGGAP